ncbi:sensor histidine kinase [Methylovorus mays]|uniref:sensor histidine kinase n=1 Tax=Methylovorus mays TaxID=184077 RepID=UPI001E3A4C51|nr:ATP-binding protein [Methylovorus mays]MCB5207174.1 HAMP domain-containing protein [Methylovorus mays]
MKYIVFISALLGAVLLYLLSHASTNTAASGNYYTLLLVLNGALAVALIVMISMQLWRLFRQMRAHVMGSRLTLRLLGAFALMAIIPGVIVYAVSVNFLTRSIESWFNVKVEAALEGGLRLGQSALDIMLSDIEEKAESMAVSLAFQPSNSHLSVLNDLREKSGVEDAVLLTLQGRILAFSSNNPATFLPELPSIPQLRQARQHVYGTIEPIPDKGLYLRVLAPIVMPDLAGETRILQLLQPVPKSLSTTAESVQDVYQDYQELSLSRESLKEVFALTLTLVLMLAMLSAVSIAFVLSRRLSAPLGVLAEGTRAIARGDYGTMLPVHGKDELGILVQSFNSMTRQLGDATLAAERNRARVEAARGYLATILAHLSSGVLALDDRAQLRTCNMAASNILGVNLSNFLEQPFQQLGQTHVALEAWVELILSHCGDDDTGEWQEEMELVTAQGKRILLVRGTRLPQTADSGFLIVFDDVTTMVQAQRDAAWGEVARRLAHEIKNPLTPIQLSAERLEHKLAAKLETDDADMLRRATNTIVTQVAAMKTMVNEFSEYARAPALNLSELALNSLINDVLALYEPADIQLEISLADGLPSVMGDATMLRQVLHNLLQNAQDALEGRADGMIQIITAADVDTVKLEVRDNGTGFPLEILSRAFEPYMTSKRHGTGLGLAIVKKIIEEHKGHIHIENLAKGGASITVTLPAKTKRVE